MDELNLEAVMNELGRSITEATEQLEEHRSRSFEGTAADGLVKAVVTNGQLELDIHLLAKRRLDREDLAAAVVQAVQDADRQARQFTVTTSLQGRAETVTGGSSFDSMFRDVMERFSRP
ncbi:Conserved DNA-binding protein YbaB [Actinopolymorpha cephalotaxi]|uniref:DNA-binding protein YbaB n=1 Tax=Actinopolymorpha cephalotaxi TaxID=504797 RepID=A0A1I3AZA0_9ACTN|nr:YbaB/EbfC family nucleoid-associated protein [Actinopolymorpha cephalotaxi]NYH84279.1 DNA-binding protein YbaB [Actinopolymorpha cephalotaxi]SFH55354.1 Conserved DNA-binding protein YbaB [Actinopolymorpha cephalotaxi]